MKVCMILEGSYPYVYGGVSSWMHQYINAMKEIDFVLWCICAKTDQKGNYKYEIPENVSEIYEVALEDAFITKETGHSGKIVLTKRQIEELKCLFACKSLDWDIIFSLFQKQKINPITLLSSKEFLKLLIENCRKYYPYAAFSDYFHTIRSLLLPELYLLGQKIPKADIYHTTATGYGGLLGSLAKWKMGKPYIVTEHGIYTREREEELLRASWVVPYFRQQWIDLFYLFSECAYQYADKVTALFSRASVMQQEIGCRKEKQLVISNGVQYENFSCIKEKREDTYCDIGAIVRIAKIKDIKNMIYAFAEVKAVFPKVRLHIMGDVDDQEYYRECRQLIRQLKLEGILFTGVVDVKTYMENIDFTILTSISEGQPLSVLESMAAKRPCVVTDVGCCRELISGEEEDTLGEAGIVVPPMHKDKLVEAILYLCRNAEIRKRMGEIGAKRVKMYYTHERSMNKYRELYAKVNLRGGNMKWQELVLN